MRVEIWGGGAIGPLKFLGLAPPHNENHAARPGFVVRALHSKTMSNKFVYFGFNLDRKSTCGYNGLCNQSWRR